MLFTQNPDGVACVIGTDVTQPADLPTFLNFCQIGMYSSPFTPTQIDPLLTLKPEPQAELPAAESVTIEFADEVSINAREAKLSLYN